MVGGDAVPRPTTPAPSSTLHDEAALLESVREAIAKSQVDRALSLLDAYDAQFAAGGLAEEAIVLRVQALLADGHRQEAQQTTADFERRHPESSYVPRLRALLQKK
jgi:outer membrane protein assembly factor BamD (BamD/ComL family)